MALVSFGDLAQSFLLRAQTQRTQNAIGRVSGELTSGRISDVAAHLGGDHARLVSVTGSHLVTKGFLTIAQEAAFASDAMQSVMTSINDRAGDVADDLLFLSQRAGYSSPNLVADRARQEFEAVISSLNTTAGGQTLFAGLALDRPALADAATILAAITTAVTGATTADDAMSRITDWFADPAGFDAIAYQGGAALDDRLVGPDDRVWAGPTAADPAFRTLLAGLAAGAMMAGLSNTLSGPDQAGLARKAHDAVATGQSEVTALSARLGVAQARTDRAVSRHQGEITALTIAQNDLTASDPYQLASELEALQTNLETIYTITARLSRLNLAGLLR